MKFIYIILLFYTNINQYKPITLTNIININQ